MICRSEKFVIGGNKVLLIGCEHENISDRFNALDSKLYNIVEDFDPTVIFVEMSNDTGFGKSGVLKDITVLEKFCNNNNVNSIFYDMEKKKYFRHLLISMFDENHVNNRAMNEFNENTSISDVIEARRTIRSENVEFYNAVFRMREKKAIDCFRNYLANNTGNRITIHCGFSHLPAYEDFFWRHDDKHI